MTTDIVIFDAMPGGVKAARRGADER